MAMLLTAARLGRAASRGVSIVPRDGKMIMSTRLRSSAPSGRLAAGAGAAVKRVPRAASRRSMSAIPKGEQPQQQIETVFERQVREAKADFKAFMTAERQPLKFAGLKATTTIGMLCGHMSFGIAALIYLETDGYTVR